MIKAGQPRFLSKQHVLFLGLHLPCCDSICVRSTMIREASNAMDKQVHGSNSGPSADKRSTKDTTTSMHAQSTLYTTSAPGSSVSAWRYRSSASERRRENPSGKGTLGQCPFESTRRWKPEDVLNLTASGITTHYCAFLYHITSHDSMPCHALP